MSQVVTRFAPSPTGFLHIGGARTALFNWLYAKKHDGRMMLRIEDTDRERSTKAAIDAIIDGLKWLGLDWDGDIVYQSARAERHAEVAQQLLSEGKAYECFETPSELEAMREKARAEGRPVRYNGHWRDQKPEMVALARKAGGKPVIRLKAPKDGETVIADAVQGQVVFQNKDLDDFILLRSDGAPTYMLAVVVDDYDMGVTQIIRGDDHLTNAARQTHIYEAMGWTAPAFAHIPLIHGPDGAKLSKRHGALGVDAYRAMGYLPAALRNYLVRLGWSQGDKEFFTTQEMIDSFDLAQVHRSPARFDYAKLENMNGHYLRDSDDDELFDLLVATLPSLDGGDAIAQALDDRKRAQLRAALPGLKARAKTLNELLDGAGFLFAHRPLSLDAKAAQLLSAEARARLATLVDKLAPLPNWTAATTEGVVRDLATALGVKLGDLAQPLRAALTGRATSPGIFDVLEILGREESLARISDQAAVG